MSDDTTSPTPPEAAAPPPRPPAPVPAPQNTSGSCCGGSCRSRGGMKGCAIAGCALLIIFPVLGGMLFLGLAAIGSVGMMTGSKPQQVVEEVIEPGDSSGKIVVLDVSGILYGGTPQAFAPAPLATRLLEELDAIEQDSDVVAVVLDMNTPGGEVTATDEVHHKIQQLRKDRGIKFVTCMRTIAASGGYYLAAGTDHIVANRLTLTGSIGVIMGGYNMADLFEKIGVKPENYTSGRYKDLLNMGRDRTDAERALLQGMVDEMFTEFATIVHDGRGLDLETIRGLEARVFSGRQAQELKLVDELGYMEEAIASAHRLCGDSNASVIRYRPTPSLGSLIFGATAHTSGLEAIADQLKPATRAGVPYYLMPLAQ